jgi:dienelactone hydrolase
MRSSGTTMTILDDHVNSWMTTVPRIWEATHLVEPGLRGVFFESVRFRGTPTRVFAWIGLPDGASPARPVPGMVLIHGGGGTAFARWVRWWNQRGYAAIAMDTCGAMPLPDTGAVGSADWPRHSHSGPRGWGGMNQADWPPQDQWSFHAVAAVVSAHTLLASLPEVAPARIGMTGISWGGYLTSLVAGLDPRHRCAMPVYGCAFTQELAGWSHNAEFQRLTPEQQRFWLDHWAPSVYLPRATCPMLWLNGTNDFAFFPPVWQRSAACTRGPRQLCLKLRYPHGHFAAAEEARELGAFADACLGGGTPLLSVAPATLANGVLRAAYGAERPLRAATLLMTPDTGLWSAREWHTLPAEVDRDRRIVAARLPEGTTAACLSLVSDDWLTTTSDVVFGSA